MAELIDVFDENRIPTGEVIDRKAEKLGPGRYMLYVLALIEDEDGRFLITRRTLDKKWAAGAWEIPGGGQQAGESSFEAVCREVLEETGLDISGVGFEERFPAYMYRNTDPSGRDNYFCDIYHIHLQYSDSDVKLQESETLGFTRADYKGMEALNATDGFLHLERIHKTLFGS
ncbi:MAG: NUDIX hydrolase [Eubacteriales bacterium]|nr:NUDIX hydrolase [Eubacteriales bacterium]